MSVKINGVYIEPAPTVAFSKEYQNNISGAIGADFSISLNGNLLAIKGNPEPTGISQSNVYSSFSVDDDPVSNIDVDDLLLTIMKKQEYLREVAKPTGVPPSLLLEVLGFGTNSGLRCYCDVEDISFDDKTRWTYYCGYTIKLKCNTFLDSATGIFSNNSTEDTFQYSVSSGEETWSVQESEITGSAGDVMAQAPIYKVSHTVSANGKKVIDSNGNYLNDLTPFHHASGYVHEVIGVGLSDTNYPISPIYNISELLDGGYAVTNRTVTEQINELAGQYSVSEEFTLMPDGQLATESVEVTVNRDLSAFTSVSINGTIQGVNTSAIGFAKDIYDNANAYYNSVKNNLYTRANTYAPTDLNTTPLTSIVGRNFNTGTITYNNSYNNRPSQSLSNAITEEIDIIDTYPGQIIGIANPIGGEAEIVYTNSRTEFRRALSISAVMDINTTTGDFYRPSDTELQSIYSLYAPTGPYAYYLAPTERWNPKTGAYSYNIEWVYRAETVAGGITRRA